MDRRILAALGLAAGGVAQLTYGGLIGLGDTFGLISAGEGAGLLLAAVGVARAQKLPGPWVVGGLALAALMAIPWFTVVGGLDAVGATANVLNNGGSVVAAAGALGWALAYVAPGLGVAAVRAGLGLQALGTFVRLPFMAAVGPWTFAFLIAFVGFALATWAFPPGRHDASAGAAVAAASGTGAGPAATTRR